MEIPKAFEAERPLLASSQAYEPMNDTMNLRVVVSSLILSVREPSLHTPSIRFNMGWVRRLIA